MKFRSGAVSATVWENARKDGTLFPSVKLSRSYRDRQTQDWKETSSFSVNDLPVVAILARKAFEALALDNAVGSNGHGVPSQEASPEEPEGEPLDLAAEVATAVEGRGRGRKRGGA
jgi:hypothetical protein